MFYEKLFSVLEWVYVKTGLPLLPLLGHIERNHLPPIT